jgi:hypothetical protein
LMISEEISSMLLILTVVPAPARDLTICSGVHCQANLRRV